MSHMHQSFLELSPVGGFSLLTWQPRFCPHQAQTGSSCGVVLPMPLSEQKVMPAAGKPSDHGEEPWGGCGPLREAISRLVPVRALPVSE